jgi:two-component system sensor histidine kinase RegB
MTYPYPRKQASLRQHLKLMINLRWMIILGQAVTIYVVSQLMEIALPITKMGAVLGFLVLLNGLSIWRHRVRRPVSRIELWAQLSIDVLALTLQLYLSGGAANPFTGFYLLQVIIAAIILTPLQTWLMVLLTISSYVCISIYYLPIMAMTSVHHGHGEFFDLHLQGMLISFSISSVLVALFVTKMAKNMRHQGRLISQYKERERADQVILNIGMAAATAAHEMGTPLSTISTVLEEMEDNKKSYEKATKGSGKLIETLQTQITRCKEALSLIMTTSGSVRAEGLHTEVASDYIHQLLTKWQGETHVSSVEIEEEYPFNPIITVDQVLDKALLNVLNNAADAAKTLVNIRVEAHKEGLVMEVRDDGEGFSAKQMRNLPQPMKSSKKSGFGVGLFLAHSVVTKLGGTLLIGNRVAEGAKVRIRLPWELLLAEDSDE